MSTAGDVFKDIQRIEADVLIIGGGAAGMIAAVGAIRAGARPLVVTKGTYASGSSSMARGGYSVAIGHADPEDSPQLFFEDAIKASYGLANPRLARLMCSESIDRTLELDAWGLGLVKRPDGRFDQRESSRPHRYPRLVHCGKLMGKPLMQALARKTRALGVEPLDHVMLVDLLRADGEIVGAWGFRYREGVPVLIHARSTVIATGGAPQLHEINDSPPTVTGDGYAMALRAGAELIDMEFIDYQLLTAAPAKLVGYPCHSSGFLNHGGHLLNRDGERFMSRYDPQNMERAPRAMINRGVAMEIFEGRGTGNNAVCIDVRHVFEEINVTAMADVVKTFVNAGVDPRKDFMEVTSGPHTYLGGVRIDEWGRTTVEGLYAGGEAAGGVHGANRLGGAALSDTYVFGYRAGIAAGCEAAARKSPARDAGEWREAIDALRERIARPQGGVSPDEWRRGVQKLVISSIGQVRREDRLVAGLAKLDEFEKVSGRVGVEGESVRERCECLRKTLETQNLIAVARMLGTAALNRKESRGGHFRLDYPAADNGRYLGNIALWREGGALRHELRPVPDVSRGAKSPPRVPSTAAMVA
ncbi:MAG: FAD-binding protein [Betaproteobacteria bacterium]|nr:FAD-binding protein [Betaproteobacteria bacterium]